MTNPIDDTLNEIAGRIAIRLINQAPSRMREIGWNRNNLSEHVAAELAGVKAVLEAAQKIAATGGHGYLVVQVNDLRAALAGLTRPEGKGGTR